MDRPVPGAGRPAYDTGLVVHHLVRVRAAVLASYEYGEGNGSPEGREGAIERAS